jgi:hypothetical protein
MTTIVSAFISNANSYRDISKYIEYGTILLSVETPKVIFMEKSIYDEHLCDVKFPNTHFVFVEKTDNYLYEQKEKITQFNIESTNPGKDTLEYMLLICNKTEWMKQAIELDPYKTDQFIWIDFGIKHVFDCNNEEFISKIECVSLKKYDNVRIAGGWDLNAYYHDKYNTRVLWFFLGGVFGGNKTSLCKFADLMKTRCLDFIDQHQSLIWEVNLWYFIYNDNKDLFDVYRADHNKTIVDDY